MIQKTVKKTMDRMEIILASGAEGNCMPLLGALSDMALVCGPMSTRTFGRDESIAAAQAQYLNTFTIENYQLSCHESKGPLMIVTGEYHISMKDSGIPSSQYVSAVWRQIVPGNDVVLEYLDFHLRGDAVPVREKRKPKILLTDAGGTTVQTEPEEILYVLSDRNYVSVKLKSGEEMRIKSTLHGMAEKLGEPQFLLFSRKSIINLDAVQKITKDSVIMTNGMCFRISAKSRSLVRKLLRSYGSLRDQEKEQ